jgi:nucleoside 2-deoxyribosyltransferase
MKIYLAARYSRKDEMNAYAKMLTRGGYTVTSRWLEGHNAVWSGYEDLMLTAYAMADLEDIDKADTVISFTEPRGTPTTGGGRHVEFGYGYLKGKRMIIIGERENIFHHLPHIEIYSTLDAFLEAEENGPELRSGTAG